MVVFLHEQRKERANEEEEQYQHLSDAYNEFLKVVLANADLQLRSASALASPTPEQVERRLLIFDMLVSLFERAYLVAYKDDMAVDEQRRWNSWDDYMREWCRRADFRNALPDLLRGEDPAFQAYMQRVAALEAAAEVAAQTQRRLPNTFLRMALPVPTGSCRILRSSSPITRYRPSSARPVT